MTSCISLDASVPSCLRWRAVCLGSILPTLMEMFQKQDGFISQFLGESPIIGLKSFWTQLLSPKETLQRYVSQFSIWFSISSSLELICTILVPKNHSPCRPVLLLLLVPSHAIFVFEVLFNALFYSQGFNLFPDNGRFYVTRPFTLGWQDRPQVMIDQMFAMNRTLSAAEISALMSGPPAAQFLPNLFLYWDFESVSSDSPYYILPSYGTAVKGRVVESPGNLLAGVFGPGVVPVRTASGAQFSNSGFLTIKQSASGVVNVTFAGSQTGTPIGSFFFFGFFLLLVPNDENGLFHQNMFVSSYSFYRVCSYIAASRPTSSAWFDWRPDNRHLLVSDCGAFRSPIHWNLGIRWLVHLFHHGWERYRAPACKSRSGSTSPVGCVGGPEHRLRALSHSKIVLPTCVQEKFRLVYGWSGCGCYRVHCVELSLTRAFGINFIWCRRKCRLRTSCGVGHSILDCRLHCSILSA